jgi:hypothetical protein
MLGNLLTSALKTFQSSEEDGGRKVEQSKVENGFEKSIIYHKGRKSIPEVDFPD